MSSTQLRGVYYLLLVVVLVVLCAGFTQSASVSRPRRHYAGRLPMGIDVKDFLQVCQLCGEFYGTSYSSGCVHDKTFQTFVLCMESVGSLRK